MPLKIGSSAEALIGIDEHGIIVYWNDEATKLLGRSARESIGRECKDILQGIKPAGGHLCGPNCPVRESCRNLRAPRRFEMIVRHADGTELWLDITTFIVFDDDDRPVSMHLLSESVAAHQLTTIAQSVVRSISQAHALPHELTLTHRERDVLALLAEGLSTDKIAERLHLSKPTVRNHVQNLLPKLGVHSRAEAVVFAIKYGLVHLH